MGNVGRRGSAKAILLILILGAAAFFGREYFVGKAQDEARAEAQAVEQAKPQAPVVVLHVVRKADLAVPREYIGRVEPIQSVSIRPQISGEIAEVHFQEGSMVKEGDLLFSIDDRQFRTTVSLRKAELAKAEANYDRASKYLKRLKAADSRSVSASDIDMAQSDLLQAKALVQQAKASLSLAQIDLSYTKIKAPITGKVGEAFYTKGNYVTPAGTTTLTKIVQMDPIRVSFALPDREYLDQLDSFKSRDQSVFDATIKLVNGEVYPKKGERDFEDNVMDKGTGTITVSLRFENDGGALVPGSMVRIEARPSRSNVVPVIPQESVMADGQGDFVYVVDDANKVDKRGVVVGDSIGKNCEVLSGLEGGERIVFLGLQSVRPGMVVSPIQEETDGEKSPAELAQASDYDLKPIVSGDGEIDG